MLTFVVMPCLNETGYVERAIESLLAPADDHPHDAHLVVVDNGSSDETLGILEALCRRHRGRVHIGRESRRGYVPPRRTGVRMAAELSAARGMKSQDVLILQADADTVYRRGYVSAMEAAADAAGDALILEGATRRPTDFSSDHPDYLQAERTVDAGLEELEAADEDDVILDDKVCAYRLSDYLRWGGLREEVDTAGDQIHAETTRLFIHARLSKGARKLRVNTAGAAPSPRKVLADPRYHFATMGFPRERSWRIRTKSAWSAIDIDDFSRSVLQGGESEAVFLRRAHSVALFRFLPAAIIGLEERDKCGLLDERDVQAALALIPGRTAEEVASKPAVLLMDILRLIDTHPMIFES